MLSIIIPAYNEAKRLPKTLSEIDKYLSKQNYNYEILVINDGSKDETSDVINGLNIKNLRFIDNKENHGKGYVVRQGMLEAKGKYRLFTDADNSTSIDQVENILPWFDKGYEVIIGSREVAGAKLAVPQPWIRRFLGGTFRFIVNVFTGLWEIKDTQCGFKAFSDKAVDDIFPRLTLDRWAFDVEILCLARKLNYKVKEVPVVWINDLESKVNFKGMVKMFFEVLQVRWNLIFKKYE